jgi:hypothetical protein
VTEYGKNGRTTKVKLHDKLAAMAQLSKLLNMLVDRQEVNGPGGGPVEVTDYRARITERLNDIAKRTAPDNDGTHLLLDCAEPDRKRPIAPWPTRRLCRRVEGWL